MRLVGILAPGILSTLSLFVNSFGLRQFPRTCVSQKHHCTLQRNDPEVYNLLKLEEKRQREGINLIASENFVSFSVLEALGSHFTNKYSEGQPGKRYYGGNEHIDELETLCQRRALECFDLDPSEWGVNVQPYSGSIANFAVYTALMKPQEDRLMGLALNSGGHLSHGYFNKQKKVSASSIYFKSQPYYVDSQGWVDYEELDRTAEKFCPKLLICGSSAYPREWDYQQMKTIADRCGALLMTDMAHVSGLVAAGVVASPFPHSHVVTTTTHKSLRGPRAALIFYRKEFKSKIDSAVFPGLQGGPHNNQIAAVAVALKDASSPAFRAYAAQVLANAKCLAKKLVEKGYTLITGGTDNHMLLLDFRNTSLSGTMVERCLEKVSISTNKNTLPGDRSAVHPGGVRIGTCALTSRRLTKEHMSAVAEFIHRGICIAQQARFGEEDTTDMNRFETFMSQLEIEPIKSQIKSLKFQVEKFSEQFYMPDILCCSRPNRPIQNVVEIFLARFQQVKCPSIETIAGGRCTNCEKLAIRATATPTPT